MLALLTNAYVEEENRVLLKLHPKIAPYTVAVFPLVKNKPDIVAKAREVYGSLVALGYNVAWDERGNVGKRYLSQDEIGTPYCVTVDYDTLENGKVTVRDRDTTKQDSVSLEKLEGYIKDKAGF
jgi:glycyl-tRNA synthetase